MNGDLHNQLKFVSLTGPNASTTGTTAVVGAILDLAGYESCELVFHIGQMDDAAATFAVTLEHGNDSALSDTTVPAANDLIGVLATDVNWNQGDDNEVHSIGYKGGKRYLRPTLTPTANAAAAAFGILAILGHARHNPPGGTF